MEAMKKLAGGDRAGWQIFPVAGPQGLQTKRFLNVQALAGLCRGLQVLPFGSAAVLAQMPGPEGHKPASGKGIKTVCHGGQSGIVIHGNARSL